MQTLSAVVVFAAAVCVCNGYRGTNFYNPAESLLTCRGQNPFAGYPGQPYEVEVDIPKIPPQPGEHGEVPLPVDSGYACKYVNSPLFLACAHALHAFYNREMVRVCAYCMCT